MKWIVETAQIYILMAVIVIIAIVVKYNTPTARAPRARSINLQYQILLERDGVLTAVPETFPFWSSDRVRLAFQADADCHTYIFAIGSSGTAKMLYPSPQIDGGANQMTAGLEHIVPNQGHFMFDQTPGTEELAIFVVRRPLEEIEQTISVDQIATTAWEQYVAPYLHRLADITKDVQYVPNEPQPVATALFNHVSCLAASEEALLLHRIRLTHY
ncbi:MAG: DUF4384 domain-containing protein [Phycisphaerae bacterium]|nr:DUF4384 domain-containing protein [Phycisphaerae bacterium]